MSYILEHLHALKSVEVETITAELQALCDDIQSLDRANQQRSMSLLCQITQRQEHMMPAEDTQHLSLQTDAALHLNASSLHKQIGMVAAQTAEVLLRLGRFARGFPHMQPFVPQLSGHQVYQGWLLQGKQIYSVGLLNVQNGVATLDFQGNLTSYDAAAVSLERGPIATSNAPKGPVVAVGALKRA